MKLLNYFILTVIVIVILYSCDTSTNDSVVKVIARDFNFEVVDEIPSGWTTFQFENLGHAEHFFLLNLLPDTISFETYHNDVTRPFDVVFDSLKAGKSKAEAIGMLIEMIPGWYFTSVKSMGGTGIVDAGKTTQVTLKLTPGTYAMECYIKEQGVFHTALGMIRSITVTEEFTELEHPQADMDITLTNYKIETKGEVKTGKNTVAVHFKEHPELGLGNDVHLIRMNDTTDIDEVIFWLDWMNIKGLESPAPVEFLGGAQEMPVGYTAYFTVDLVPGNYAWISESSAAKGMVEMFSVK
jgi:plastocyanin